MVESLGKLVSELAITHIEQWHEEDRARSGGDHKVAQAKKIIDKLNQKRTDLIEKIDEVVFEMSKTTGK